MKKLIYLIVLTLILGLVLTGCLLSNVGQVPATEQSGISAMVKSKVFPKDYDNVTIVNWGSGNFSDVWDLTQCDLTLSYTLDMSDIQTAGWAVTEVGLREVGGSNIDPNLQGGWMQSNYIGEFNDPNDQDLNDFHFLSKHGWSLQQYDAIDPDNLRTPYWSGANYGFWFDRDGVDPWQDDDPSTPSPGGSGVPWGVGDGVTYNTGGVYEIVITYHLFDLTTGTMFATINGVQQGLYIGGGKDAEPEFYPAGRTFTGDMTQMQVFYGRGGGGGTVIISDITVNGCLWSIVINGCDTGVADTLVVVEDEEKRISEHIEDIYIEAKNHGQFVRGVAKLTNDLMKAGIITGEEKGKIQSCAAQANQLPKEYGLVLWLDAGKGITATSGVSKWEDQSGSGNHAVQATASYQPTYVGGELNDNPVVRFPGGEKYLRHSPILTDSYTAFYVLKLSESAGNLVYYYHAGNVHTGDLGFFAETKNKEEGWGSAGNVDTSVTVRTSEFYPTPLNWRIHTHQPEALYKDGVEVEYSERKDNVYAGNLTDIGSRSDHPTLFFVGDIAEILVYDRILTVHEREMVEAYLNAKYDIY
jgi:hypothetical protein